MNKIGYWASPGDESGLPTPRETTVDVPEFLIEYVKSGKVHDYWLGWHTCRICGAQAGTACLTDGIYKWPEGFAHYLREHRVDLDEYDPDFIPHVKRMIDAKYILGMVPDDDTRYTYIPYSVYSPELVVQLESMGYNWDTFGEPDIEHTPDTKWIVLDTFKWTMFLTSE